MATDTQSTNTTATSVRIALFLLAAAGVALAFYTLPRVENPNASNPAPILRLDPNLAPTEALLALPGIGPARAKSIIANRPYATLHDIDAQVPGFGPKRTADVAPYLRFANEPPPGPGAIPR